MQKRSLIRCAQAVLNDCIALGGQPAEIRSERIGGKHFLPAPWRELINSRGRMLADALQDVNEVVIRVDVMKPAGGQPTLHDADVLCAQLGPAEQPIAPPIGITRSARSM